MSRSAKEPLVEAEGLYRRRRWAELIRLLEPLSPLYAGDERFHVMLGSAYLHRDDIGGAFSSFRRAQNLDYRSLDASRGLAAVHIRRGESDKAVQLFVEILERHPRDSGAKRGLKFLRKTGDSRGGAYARRLRTLYPSPRNGAAYLAIAAAAALLAAIGFVGLPIAIKALSAPRDRPGIGSISLSAAEIGSVVGSGGGFDIVLTEKEALNAFENAKRLFSRYRDEAALVEINRLLLSNASPAVKAKAEALASYARTPDFSDLPDRYDYAQVSSEPWLYEGVGVAWKGLPANITTWPGAGSFDLLVGYHDKKRLDGIVRVSTSFTLDLEPDVPIELLAKVRMVGKDQFYLEGLAVHRLGKQDK